MLLPFCEPAGYRLGKRGWVAANFEGVEMLKAWLDESDRAQAPKTLVKQLDGAPAKPATKAKPKPKPKPKPKSKKSR